MKTSELLKAAKVKITDEKCWTQRASARDFEGVSVAYDSVAAVCFCSIGAIDNTYTYKHSGEVSLPHSYLYKAMGGMVTLYNDTHTHAEVMATWDEAIKLAENDND